LPWCVAIVYCGHTIPPPGLAAAPLHCAFCPPLPPGRDAFEHAFGLRCASVPELPSSVVEIRRP
jgi:hypothetical protein